MSKGSKGISMNLLCHSPSIEVFKFALFQCSNNLLRACRAGSSMDLCPEFERGHRRPRKNWKPRKLPNQHGFGSKSVPNP